MGVNSVKNCKLVFLAEVNSFSKVLGARNSTTCCGISPEGASWLISVVAEASRGQILKGLVITAKNFGFYPEGYFCGSHPLSPPSVLSWTVTRLNLSIWKITLISVVIKLGIRQGSGCYKSSYKAIRGGNSVYPGAGECQWEWREVEESGEIWGEEWMRFGEICVLS